MEIYISSLLPSKSPLFILTTLPVWSPQPKPLYICSVVKASTFLIPIISKNSSKCRK